jgi:hypothetical protein
MVCSGGGLCACATQEMHLLFIYLFVFLIMYLFIYLFIYVLDACDASVPIASYVCGAGCMKAACFTLLRQLGLLPLERPCTVDCRRVNSYIYLRQKPT